MKIDAVAFSFAGDKYIGRSYAEMDCQRFVEKCMSDCGLHKDLPGSNAWFRAMTWTGTPEECVRVFGQVPKGALVFILEHDGKEPAKYRGDGIGNASHIGIVIHRHEGAIHSSQKKGGVVYSEFKNKTIRNGGWNRIGLWDQFDYGKSVNWMLDHIGIGEKPGTEEGTVETMQGRLTAENGSTVNLRKTKNGDLLDRIPLGTEVTVIDYGPEWCKVITGGLTGWIMTKFIEFDGDVTPGDDDEPVAPDPAEAEDEDDFLPWDGDDDEQSGTVKIELPAAACASAYPLLRALCEQIEQKVGRG